MNKEHLKAAHELLCGGAIALSNSFSINMLSNHEAYLGFYKLTLEEAKFLASNGIDSHVGHADMAAVVGNLLGQDVPMVRDTISFPGILLVAQYSGPRLPEGTTALPEGSVVEFWLVENNTFYH